MNHERKGKSILKYNVLSTAHHFNENVITYRVLLFVFGCPVPLGLLSLLGGVGGREELMVEDGDQFTRHHSRGVTAYESQDEVDVTTEVLGELVQALFLTPLLIDCHV